VKVRILCVPNFYRGQIMLFYKVLIDFFMLNFHIFDVVVAAPLFPVCQ